MWDRVVVVAMQHANIFAWSNVLDHGTAKLSALFLAVIAGRTVRVQDGVDDCCDGGVRGDVVERASFRKEAFAHSAFYPGTVQTLGWNVME